MSFFEPPPKPKTALGWHRTLSPTAGVKVSPVCLGGISLGNAWSDLFGKSQDAHALLDAYFALGGNFVDTSNTYNAEDSERLLGEWMEARGTRDQMVVATKYSAGYRAYNREREPLQSNFTGNSAKSMHVSVRDSLRKLRTEYIDILYVHWWDLATSVEEVMRHLHVHVMARQVLYLGVSDTPAWVVVKANEFARNNGLTPFSVYQGRWSAAFRDMESEIIPMCEDQGMAIVSWASLGGGQLQPSTRRAAPDPDAPADFYGFSDADVPVCDAIEKIATDRGVTFEAVALAYLFHQSTHVFPIVGVQNVDHVNAMPDALHVELSKKDVAAIQDAKMFNPLFPNSFLFDCRGGKGYSTRLTAADNVQYQMAAWIDAPHKGVRATPPADLPSPASTAHAFRVVYLC